MQLADQLFNALQVEPGLTKEELRRKFPNANGREFVKALAALEQQGLIEMRWPGKYCCLAQPTKPTPLTPVKVSVASFIEPPSKARLMGGR